MRGPRVASAISVVQFGGAYGDIDAPLLHGLKAFQRIRARRGDYLAALGRNGLSIFRVGVDGALTLNDQLVFDTAFLPGRAPGLCVLTIDGARPAFVPVFIPAPPPGDHGDQRSRYACRGK